MQALARQDSSNHVVHDAATGVLLSAALPGPLAVERWLRRYWTIKADPTEVEWIKRPVYRILDADLMGDCDDSATLAAALLLSHPETVRDWLLEFRAIRMPLDLNFSHVWLSATSGDFRVDIDPIVPLRDLPVRGYVEELTLRLN